MSRVSSRVIASSIALACLSVALVQPAAARPRSWFLPQVEVACTVDDGPAETFLGDMQLGSAALLKGDLTVDGSIAGSCGSGPMIDTTFRTTIAVTEASCHEAVLTLGDLEVRDLDISLSEDPITIAAGGPGALRGALCALAATQDGRPKPLVKTLNRVLALQG